MASCVREARLARPPRSLALIRCRSLRCTRRRIIIKRGEMNDGGFFFVFEHEMRRISLPSRELIPSLKKFRLDSIGNRKVECFSKIFITYERIFLKFSTRGNIRIYNSRMKRTLVSRIFSSTEIHGSISWLAARLARIIKLNIR